MHFMKVSHEIEVDKWCVRREACEVRVVVYVHMGMQTEWGVGSGPGTHTFMYDKREEEDILLVRAFKPTLNRDGVCNSTQWAIHVPVSHKAQVDSEVKNKRVIVSLKLEYV